MSLSASIGIIILRGAVKVVGCDVLHDGRTKVITAINLASFVVLVVV